MRTDGAVGILALGPVRLVHHHAHKLLPRAVAALEIVGEDLRRDEEHPPIAPAHPALLGRHGAGHFCGLCGGYADNVAAGDYLLRNERLGGRHKDDLAGGKPAKEVVHHHGGDEGLAETSGERDERILEQSLGDDGELVLATRKVG